MSDFFDSEIIQEELAEINRLQEEIYGTLLSFLIWKRMREWKTLKNYKLC